MMTDLKGIYTGAQIIAAANGSAHITRSQTGKATVKAITAKYGSVQPKELYFHMGNGNWKLYSLASDKRRTGKLASSLDERNSRPNKYDWEGVDTKDDSKPYRKTTPAKKVVTPKAVQKPAKVPVKQPEAAVKVQDDEGAQRAYAYINKIKKQSKKAFAMKYLAWLQKGKPKPDLDIPKDVSPADLIDISGNLHKALRLGAYKELYAEEKKPKIAEKPMSGTGKPTGRKPEKKVPVMKHTPVTKTIQKPASGKRYRYASFMRPLGSWLNVGIPFQNEDVTAADKDFRYERMPHSVISTASPIDPEKLNRLELTDLEAGRKLKELADYTKGQSGITDNMKEQIFSMLMKGKITTKKEIDAYVEKGRKVLEKQNARKAGASAPAASKKISDMADKLKNGKKPEARQKADTGEYNQTLAIKAGIYLKVGLRWSNAHGNKFKLVDIKTTNGAKSYGYINEKNPDKVYYKNERDIRFDIQMDRNSFKLEADQKKRDAEFAAKDAADKKKKEDTYADAISGLEGFELTFTPLRRTKAIEVLNKLIRYNGKVMTKKEYIRVHLEDGFRPKHVKWSNQGRKINGEYKGKDKEADILQKGNDITNDLNKTEKDFADYLLKKGIY